MKSVNLRIKEYLSRGQELWHRWGNPRIQSRRHKMAKGLAVISVIVIGLLLFNIASVIADTISLRPDGDGTRNSWTNTSGGATNLYADVDDDPSAAKVALVYSGERVIILVG